jgi:hypothetical protein
MDFTCETVAILPAAASPCTETAARGDFDPARGAFLALVKRALPDVEEIAVIPEKHPSTKKARRR